MTRDIIAEFNMFAGRTLAVEATPLPTSPQGLTALFNQKSPFAQDPVYDLVDKTKYSRILPHDPTVREIVQKAADAGYRVHFDFFMACGVPEEMPSRPDNDSRRLRVPVRQNADGSCYISASTRCMIG